MKALIPAAGLGTRFLPVTKVQPKEMLPVATKPVIQYVVEEGLVCADEVVIINSHDKKVIEEHFAPSEKLLAHLKEVGKDKQAEAVETAGNLNVSYVYQEEALGLGHAVLQGAPKTGNEAFFVMLGDVICPDNDVLPAMKKISDEHNGASVIAVVEVPNEKVDRFGVIAGQDLGNGTWKVDKLVEKPACEEAPSNLAVLGRYLLSPRVMELLKDTKPGVGGEIQLTDALDAVLKEEEMYALIVRHDQSYDTGTIETWISTNMAMFEKENGHMPAKDQWA